MGEPKFEFLNEQDKEEFKGIPKGEQNIEMKEFEEENIGIELNKKVSKLEVRDKHEGLLEEIKSEVATFESHIAEINDQIKKVVTLENLSEDQRKSLKEAMVLVGEISLAVGLVWASQDYSALNMIADDYAGRNIASLGMALGGIFLGFKGLLRLSEDLILKFKGFNLSEMSDVIKEAEEEATKKRLEEMEEEKRKNPDVDIRPNIFD
jgi:hypothetical protein